ncbi:MAG: hypothetical protein K8R68_10800 [Bacteroidales bacterium]|nr:hypothetical protein [Bacteroidales bacterium]
MKASHGSVKKVKDIIGRDEEIQKIWNILEKQSVVIASLRRMGKTCILQKMAAQPIHGWKALHYFVQGKKSPGEFVDGLYKLLIEVGIAEDKFIKLKNFYEKHIGGKSFGNFNTPEFKSYWKDLLEKIFEDIAALPENNILLMIDEFPMMLWDFINDEKLINESKELLDTLRKIREQYEGETGIRFIFCGSIGMKVVLNKLNKEHNYVGEPINNMFKVNVLEMNHTDANLLCKHLYLSKYKTENKEKLFNYIGDNTNHLPFFIDHVFTKIQSLGITEISNNNIDAIIDDLINDPNNNSEFDHFSKRIKTYYPKNEKKMALDILDILSKYQEAVSEAQILNELKASEPIDERFTKEVLKQLFEDLYLIRTLKDEDRYYVLRYELLRKWWRLNFA